LGLLYDIGLKPNKLKTSFNWWVEKWCGEYKLTSFGTVQVGWLRLTALE